MYMGGFEKILAPNHMRDALFRIIQHRRQMIRRAHVPTGQDKIPDPCHGVVWVKPDEARFATGAKARFLKPRGPQLLQGSCHVNSQGCTRRDRPFAARARFSDSPSDGAPDARLAARAATKGDPLARSRDRPLIGRRSD